MPLADRRVDAPRLQDLPSFNITTPTRGIPRPLPSSGSPRSLTPSSIETLPRYNVAAEDDNPDVITTSVEIDPELDDEVSIELRTPPAVRINRKAAQTRKERSFKTLFSRTAALPSPGVRITTPQKILKSRSKDIRDGFPLAFPLDVSALGLDISVDEWMNLISRINILLSSDHMTEVQELLDSHPLLSASSCSFTFSKLSTVKPGSAEPVTLDTTSHLGTSPSVSSHPLLTVPELNPSFINSSGSGYESDESVGSSRPSLFDPSTRRGSAVSVSSSTTSFRSRRSNISQRIMDRFERKEEWCLLIA